MVEKNQSTAESASIRFHPVRILADLIRYAGMGVIAAGVDFATYITLTSVTALPPLYINSISRSLGGLVSFVLHKFVTFENRGIAANQAQFGRFWVVWCVAFLISNAFLSVYHYAFGWGRVFSKFGAEGAAAVFTFLTHRYWTYRGHPEDM